MFQCFLCNYLAAQLKGCAVHTGVPQAPTSHRLSLQKSAQPVPCIDQYSKARPAPLPSPMAE